MGMGELPVESRLANAGLAHHGDDLTVPGSRALHSPTELVQFGLPADEAGQAPGGRGMQSGAHGACPEKFVHLHRLGETLHRQGADGLDLNVTFSKVQRGGTEENAARVSKLTLA